MPHRSSGCAFGGLALLYNCPRTATVKATSDSQVWGASGTAFKQMLQHNATKHQAETLKFLDSTSIFEGLTKKQKIGLAEATFSEVSSAKASAEDASDFTRKMLLAKKVHIFRHLSEEQTKRVVESFDTKKYSKGEEKRVRSMAKNSYIGERALLFHEPRTATVKVISQDAELWAIEKARCFHSPPIGRLQDTNFGLKDLIQVKVIGAGAAGVVRLVEHNFTRTRYALKRVKKVDGEVPEEVQRECSLLTLREEIHSGVNTFETKKSVYILTELITGGELHGAIREIPTVLGRAQAQFYTGSLVIVLEELSERNILYRDLKPENVMLDAQGYLKLIDFGIAKKLPDGESKTFTMSLGELKIVTSSRLFRWLSC
eukprot:g13764.t1